MGRNLDAEDELRDQRALVAQLELFYGSQPWHRLRSRVEDLISSRGAVVVNGHRLPGDEVRVLQGEVKALKQVLKFADNDLRDERRKLSELSAGAS